VAFHQFGDTVKFPRNEHVDIHVREVTLNPEVPTKQVDCIEIREFIKEGEVYGHGIVLPLSSVRDLEVALKRLQKESSRA
jgi:hypothetical protein